MFVDKHSVMYSVIVAFCNVFAFFNVGLPCTLYFVLWLSIKVFVLKKKKKYCIIIRMHNRVTVSDEISLICTVLCTEVLKNQ